MCSSDLAGIVRDTSADTIEAIKKTRGNAKADGTLALYGMKAAVAQFQGTRMGIITTDLDEENIPTEMRVFFQKEGKQVSPSEIGIEPEVLEPQFVNMLSFREVSEDGTVIFTINKPEVKS